MQLTDQQLGFYSENILAFSREDKRKYQSQIDNLKEKLTNAIHANSSLRITKINQAGSWRKGTALKPKDGFEIDIDLIVYLDVAEATRSDVSTLHGIIVGLLRDVYGSKASDDFKESKKTVGIEFRTSGLKVDLVPVIPVQSPADYVWQPEVGGGGSFLTSPTKQLGFVLALKDRDPRYTSVVRLLKRWRNMAELRDELSSFTLELICAHIVGTQGPPPRIEEGLLRVLTYIATTELKQPVSFADAIRSCPSTASPVRIFDPTNNENNVTSRLGEQERRTIVARAADALETLNYARTVDAKGTTMECWKEVFGPSFRIEEV
ncbi:CBASS oligonucleotide cyclase [Chondromyces apiculatus]|uniref:CBASS oligonucleotide cyclase n=1 Tax=Chondromyces apiculatus TaxID=51 RepID=UPI0005C6608F|nr:CBASS oligonucleotide cyclase [Chondromyces apiculatus]